MKHDDPPSQVQLLISTVITPDELPRLQGAILTLQFKYTDTIAFLSKNQWKLMIFWVLGDFPAATKRTRPAESDFDIRFERKLIFLGQLLIGSMDL